MATPDNSTYGKLIDKLRELFELDKADLDFGIYRIIRQRQDEIEEFLRHQLKTTVSGLLSSAQGNQQAELQAELRKAEQSVRDLGMNPDQVPKVLELREKLKALGNPQNLEDEVYEHLYRFFSRYYEEGDFISLRRVSRKAKYAIPYNGEEVKLHWANADQYYIKSSENFRDYRFKLNDGRSVHFKLLDADTNRDNTKGEKRFFRLASENALAESSDELLIHFHYTSTDDKKITDTDGKTKAPSQTVFNNLTLAAILQDVGKSASSFQAALITVQPTKANPKRTVLEKHLSDYTAKNSFDYFIHKNLGEFLRQELDFYIKNEVVYLDDIDNAQRDIEAEKALTNLQETLQKIRAIRQVAGKVIDFLAQLEDFQKKLWLKKKFVVSCDYCLTLDRVPQALYAVIAGNAAQAAEWRQWNFIEADTVVDEGLLRSQPFLMVDTRFYPAEFKFELLKSIEDIDAQCDGLLIHADNFQALNLLQDRYREQVKCIYIDPPYNTSASEIIYKNSYKNSSWLSFMEGRLVLANKFLAEDGIGCITIDDFEFNRLKSLIENMYEKYGILGVTVIKNNPAGRSTAKGFSIAHEYGIYFTQKDENSIGRLEHSESQVARYKFSDEKGAFEWVNFRKHGGANANRYARPKLFYPVFVSEEKGVRFPNIEWNAMMRSWVLLEEPMPYEKVVYPITPDGEEKTWKWGIESAKEEPLEFTVRNDQSGELGVYKKARLNSDGTLPLTVWDKKEYSSTEYGTNLLKRIFGESEMFSFPKSVHATKDTLLVCKAVDDSIVLDYFAGSGTTGHAVINLNREDNGKRKYILVEQGAYFDTVLKPRIQKVVYSENWKDGKPIAKEVGNFGGISHCFKYMRLESYEDTLNNLELKRSGQQQTLLDQHPKVKEDYLLHYMLDIEAQSSLLKVDAFTQPFNYQLHIATDSAGETRQHNIDLVETFNYLLGLSVHTQHKQTLSLSCAPDEYGVWHYQKHPDSPLAITADYTFLSINGTLPDGKSALVIWRVLNNFNDSISKTCHNIALDHFLLERLRINPREGELDVIYVNGDNTLPNIRSEEEHWKVRLIEEEFQRLMFAGAV